jgi:hypothetical protein
MGIYRTASADAENVSNAPTGFFNIFLDDSGVLMKKDSEGTISSAGGDGGIYAGDGTISGERIITMTPYTLRFDGTSFPGLFFIDSLNNRVGVGTADPTSQLHIQGSSSVTIVLETAALGLDDLTPGGTFNHQSDISYRVKIDGLGTPDTFTWSADGGTTWTATGVAVTGAAQTLNYGTTVTFGATTGHTLNNYWDFTGIANNPLKCTDEAGTDILAVTNDGKLGIGTITPDASAILECQTTTQGVLFPRMTETERDAIVSPTAGLVIYNTTTNKLNLRVAAAWEAITST